MSVREADGAGAEGRPRVIRSYVRRDGRITQSQTRALDTLWAHYALVPAGSSPNLIDIRCGSPLYLEVGVGNGESLVTMAHANPDNRYLGADVHRPGLGHLLNRAQRLGLTNLRVFDRDVHELLPLLPAEALAGVYIFFPDPWPKKKHNKRRLLQPAFFAALRHKLSRDGRVYIATDSLEYATHLRTLLPELPGWMNLAGSDVLAPRLKHRVLTKFEGKGLREGRVPQEFALARRDG